MKMKWKHSMWSFVLLLPVLAVLLLFFGYIFQEKVLFPATSGIDRTPASPPFNWAYEEVFLEVGGEKTHGWFIPLEEAGKTVLFSHGNAGNIAGRLESIQLLRSMGFSVFAYDYGGYGVSTGRPSEQRICADVEAAWNYLTVDRGISPAEIVLFGRSLGGAATAYLASNVVPAAVILESTFTSLPGVVRDMPLGKFPSKGIRHQFPTLERVRDIHAPLLVVHSKEDTLIPFKHGQAIFEAANTPKEFLEIRGDHNMGFVQSMDDYVAGWKRFFETI